MAVSFIIEQILQGRLGLKGNPLANLPLLHHPLEIIVQDENLDRYIVLGCCGKFLLQEHEQGQAVGAITVMVIIKEASPSTSITILSGAPS